MRYGYILLSEAYALFTAKRPDMPYTRSSIELWILQQSEYTTAYQAASYKLGLAISCTLSSLNERSGCFNAELLKTQSNAIILLNEMLADLGNETHAIIIHELAHAYCYSANQQRSCGDIYFQELNDSQKYLFSQGKRMWKEYFAEWIVSDTINHPLPSYKVVKKDFLSLMYDMRQYPERMGFFFFNFILLQHNYGDIANTQLISGNSDDTRNMRKVITSIVYCLEKKALSDLCWHYDIGFLINLGQMMVDFSISYLTLFERIDDFIGSN